VYGEPQDGLQHLVLLESHPQAQDDARHEVGQLSRQLDTAAIDEQVDDGAVESLAPGGGQGLPTRPADADAAPLAPQDASDGTPTARVAVDQ
jgi:hypothetical protein